MIDRVIAEPVDVAQLHAARAQRLAWTNDDPTRRRLEPHHVQRIAGRDPQPAALPDGEMNDAAMAAEHPAGEVDDLARLGRARTQPLDHVGVAPGRHEADVLAVVLVGDRKPEATRQLTRLALGPLAERKAQQIELLARRGKQEIALVTFGIARAV